MPAQLLVKWPCATDYNEGGFRTFAASWMNGSKAALADVCVPEEPLERGQALRNPPTIEFIFEIAEEGCSHAGVRLIMFCKR